MELPPILDDFIKYSIEDTLGLLVPDSSLQSKLQSLETSNHILRSQCLYVQSRLAEKEADIDLARAEAAKEAQSLKKCVEEGEKLDTEFWDLREDRRILAGECVRRTEEREALTKLRKDAEERKKVADIRVKELEDELKQGVERLQLYKRRCEVFPVDSRTSSEQILLNGLIGSLASESEVVETAQAFLEANGGVDACCELLKKWDSLKAETQNVLSLAAELRSLQKDKERIRINLQRAEKELRVLFEENSVLDEENKRLLKSCDPNTEHAGGEHITDNSNKST